MEALAESFRTVCNNNVEIVLENKHKNIENIYHRNYIIKFERILNYEFKRKLKDIHFLNVS